MNMTRFLTAKNARGQSDLTEELKGLKQERDEAIMIRDCIKNSLLETNSSKKGIQR